MTIEQMKERLVEVYPGEIWGKRVKAMRDKQVVSVFEYFQEQGKIK